MTATINWLGLAGAVSETAQERGMSLHAVAEASGVHVSSLSRLTRQGRPLSLEHVLSLSMWMDRDLWGFVVEDEG